MSELKRSMINDALRLVRLYYGLPQEELAKILDISQSMISEVERGSKSVSIDLLERYSEELGVRMSQLLFFAEELEKEPVQNKGKLVIASGVLKLLEAFAPKEFGHGSK